MATSRDEALANVFDGGRRIIDFASGRDSLARLIRPVWLLTRPLTASLILCIALTLAMAVAVAMRPDQPVVLGVMAGATLFVAVVAGACWWLARAKRQAETANAAKTRLLTALGDDLRKPLRDIARAGASIDRSAFDAGEWDKIARMRLDARAMLLQLEDIRICLDIEAGSFAPETRSFDLYRLVNGIVASLRSEAAERGIVVALRVDPLLPYQLRGWPHQLRQVLIGLLTYIVQRSGKTKLRLVMDAAKFEAEQVTLRVTVASGAADAPTSGEPAEPPAIEPGRPFGMAMVQRLAVLMGGRLEMERDPSGALRLTVELPFTIDQATLALPLDLAHLPALIVTKDQNFVGEFVEPLDAWRADTRWIGAGDAALQYLEAFDASDRRPLLIVDGRGDVLRALSFAHRAVSLPAGPPPYLLFVADEARMDSVIGLADEDFDGILPAPFTTAALRSVLHAMRVEPADWFLADALPMAPEEDPTPPVVASPAAAPATIAPLEPASRPTAIAIVTEIAAHPRFAESSAAVIDERAIGALWSLGDDREFFDGIIEAFRSDSRRVIGELSAAAAAADPHQFEEGVQALRRCTANFGGGRLRELLLSLRNLAPTELQRQGSAYVQRLEAEIGKLEMTLVDYAKAPR
jgi:signal transduction histidine kinase